LTSGMPWIYGRPNNPAFLTSDIRQDTGLHCRISGLYLADPIIYLVFLQMS
jgi:hypothetical protein